MHKSKDFLFFIENKNAQEVLFYWFCKYRTVTENSYKKIGLKCEHQAYFFSELFVLVDIAEQENYTYHRIIIQKGQVTPNKTTSSKVTRVESDSDTWQYQGKLV